MASAAEKLATSLERLELLQADGRVAIRSTEISRTHRERLLKAGFLTKVMKGWLIPSRPDSRPGESTDWYASYWDFCAQYLTSRFGDDWSLSPEQSLTLHTGKTLVPTQLMVRSPRGRNRRTNFLHGTSVFDIRAKIAQGDGLTLKDGLRLFTLEAALVSVQPSFFRTHETDARVALAMIPDASGLLARLLDGGRAMIAGRLAGAFRSIGQDQIADDIVHAMRAASFDVRESNPFASSSGMSGAERTRSPHILRIRLDWDKMRKAVIEALPEPGPTANDTDAFLAAVDEIYITDAYHSLSIEGYRVSAELIDKVRSGNRNPGKNEDFRMLRDGLAARGYWEAFQSVKESVRSVLEGQDAGEVAERDLQDWYRTLFGPSVTAGLLKPIQLAGYRNSRVSIRDSRHAPMSVDAVRDCMPVFLELLREEHDPRVRIVLGHFFLVFVHPFQDGNGRTARFLMNVMMAASGFPWLVIKVDDRDKYMASLEAASVDGDIRPFSEFIAASMERDKASRRA